MGQANSVTPGYVAAPYYPAPHGGWTADWQASYAKAQALVQNMTLAEKVNISSGTGIYMGACVGNTGSALRLGFPQLCLQDSALGVRDTEGNTAFPAGITTGATWDKSLMLARGVAMGQEFRGKGVNIYLGPTIGPMGRKPRGGRNWEGFGADPVLQGVGGYQTVVGVQEQGVIATIKHLIGNEQEIDRMYTPFTEGYSSNIDDRTIHELYLWPFADGVRAGAGAVMAAYNAVNGSACTQNSYLINNLLKDELGFQGFIMSDWLAQISGVPSALAGLDMAMPGDTEIPLVFGTSYWMYELSRSVLNGSVPVDRLDDMATRVVAAWYQMGQDQDYPPPNFSSNSDLKEYFLYPGAIPDSPIGVVNQFVDVQADHNMTARQIAQDAVTMLKNDGKVLPLSASTPIVVFGTDAQVNSDGPNACTDRNCDTGTLGMGWGSGTANYPYFDDPISAFKRRTSNVTFYNTDTFPSLSATPTPDDVAFVFLSSDSGEETYNVEGNQGDRSASGLAAWHGGDTLVQQVAEKFQTVVVVVHTVGPLVLEPWINLTSVKAVLFAHLPGQEAGESLTNVLYGDVSPSGHLPYTIPVAESDYPASVSILNAGTGQLQDVYSEGLYIDYRYLNKQGTKPRYAFGHGLSYTNFSLSATMSKVTSLTTLPPARPSKGPTPTYSNALPAASEAYRPAGFVQIWRYLYSWLDNDAADAAHAIGASNSSTYPYPAGYSDTQQPGPAAGGAQGGNPALFDVAYTLSVNVTNTGTQFAGKQVAQAYVQFPTGFQYDTPIIQLRDFNKTTTLAPGQTEALTLSLTRKDLSVWDVVLQNWVVSDGRYTIWIGDSSDTLAIACYTDTLQCQSNMPSPV